MNRLTSLPRRAAAVLTVAALGLIPLATLFATPASAHSVDSTAVSVVVAEDAVTASIDVPLGALDEALGTEPVSDPGSLTDSAESFGDLSIDSIEGVDVLSVGATVDPAGADTADFTLAYDGVVADVDGHEATVVVTEADGDIYLAGTIDGSDGSVTVGDAVTTTESMSTGALDMIGYGFHHVLEGADHLLFLLALLLPAPLLVAGRRWTTGKRPGAALGSVVKIATAFTVGHSLTLMPALGWVSIPSAPVEVFIAVSVAAVHAFLPLVRRGETIIAAVFGLIHGLAFAGILTDLGLEGTTSLTALLAFNVGMLAAVHVLPTGRLAHRRVRLEGRNRGLDVPGGQRPLVVAHDSGLRRCFVGLQHGSDRSCASSTGCPTGCCPSGSRSSPRRGWSRAPSCRPHPPTPSTS